MDCTYKKYSLHFGNPAGTSRGVLIDKETYFLIINEEGRRAYGECNLFRNLSCDDRPGYEDKLKEVCMRLPNEGYEILQDLSEWPSICFGVETVLKDWENGSRQIIFPGCMLTADGFSVPINGLIWMGDKATMQQQIAVKLKQGYRSIKLKIGAIDFDKELELLKFIRSQFSSADVELRLDANGAFEFGEAKEKIKRLSEHDISYIEQPIRSGQWQEMARLCSESEIKIALDEDLIGVVHSEKKRQLIETIAPQLLILKPALAGGFFSCDEWKSLISERGGAWVMTSALESNLGLNAIAQYTALENTSVPQGLGTGQLFTNNIPAPYTVDSKGLHYHRDKTWDFSLLQ